MSRFFLLFEQWELAESAAQRAEGRLAQLLDGYCEGSGPAPSLQEIAAAREARAAARTAFRALRSDLSLQRRTLALI